MQKIQIQPLQESQARPGSGVLPEQAHEGVPVSDRHTRLSVLFLDPRGDEQHLSITTTWMPGATSAELFDHMAAILRGFGCSLLQLDHKRQMTIEV